MKKNQIILESDELLDIKKIGFTRNDDSILLGWFRPVGESGANEIVIQRKQWQQIQASLRARAHDDQKIVFYRKDDLTGTCAIYRDSSFLISLNGERGSKPDNSAACFGISAGHELLDYLQSVDRQLLTETRPAPCFGL